MSTVGTDSAVPPRPPRRLVALAKGHRSGGSLIEVMIALVLLAVGMLALQALALAAGRSVALAERNTKSAMAAARAAESALASLSSDSLPPPMECQLADGGHLTRKVVLDPSGMVVRFDVAVTAPAGIIGTRAHNVSGYAFSPHGFSEGGEAELCP